MILRGIVYSFVSLLILQSLCGQSSGIYHKPNIDLGSSWTKAELHQVLFPTLSVLQTTGSTLELTDEINSLGGVHLTYIQSYQGVEILESGIKVNLDHKGKIYSVLNNLASFDQPEYEIESLPIAPSSVQARLQAKTDAFDVKIEPKWFVVEETLIPVYQGLTFSHGEIVFQEFLVNGYSGEILREQDKGAYFRQGDTTGRGRIFLPDPCTKAEVNYGDLFVDGSDSHPPIFDTLMDTVELKEITYQNGEFHLIGPYVHIEDRAPFNYTPATSLTGDFYFTRDQNEFEDVMVYFHIDSFQRYIQGLGYTNLQNKPFKVDPHGKSDLDNSVFVANGADSYILFGDGGVDDAEDADVIIHEYGHALSDAASPNSRNGFERKGLDEGFADYFASAWSQDFNSWGWDKVFIWDGHNEFWSGRNSINTLSYPLASGTSFYVYGELWAATMMQIRNSLGPQTADKLQIEELYSNFSGMTFPDAALLLIDADSMLFGGAHTDILFDYFCERNILLLNCLSVGVGIDEEEIENSTFDVFPNPSSGTFTLTIPKSFVHRQWHLRINDLKGKTVGEYMLENNSEQKFNVSLPPGMYLMTFRSDEGHLQTKKLVISED